LDQRGTGRSTPVGPVIPGATPQDQATYLTRFRADAIVHDAEHIRKELGVERWTLLGQSFGGFTAMTYLSIAPGGLREVLITGGLAPVGRSPDDVYAATWRKLIDKNRAYFERYPEDRARVRDIARRLDSEEHRLPNGERLTARRFRQMGMWLGNSAGWELLHHVIELPVGSPAFLYDVGDGAVRWGRNPIYATLHESSYADGFPTRWSALRTMPDEVEAEHYFTAEHVFPWMWDDCWGLKAHKDAAHLLAEHAWPKLYDAAQLRQNEVPVAATVYVHDLYVDREYAMETASLIKGLRAWITNEFEHNGLRADGERVVGRLIDMVKGRA